VRAALRTPRMPCELEVEERRLSRFVHAVAATSADHCRPVSVAMKKSSLVAK